MKTLERGDIESIDFGGHNGNITKVRGYQNFDISDSDVVAIGNPTNKRSWTDTKIKGDFFANVFDTVRPQTYADFGSNLGYYVFWSASWGIPSTGIDYNQEYIGVCNTIKARHNVAQANFLHTTLNDFSKNNNDKYDLLTAFSVIHHLYNRTEQYNNMEALIGEFSKNAHNVLFEFPTENDPKGHKWTIDTGYTEQLFVQTAEKLFRTVTRIPGQTEHRPFYLCQGS